MNVVTDKSKFEEKCSNNLTRDEISVIIFSVVHLTVVLKGEEK